MKHIEGVITYIGDKTYESLTCIQTLKKKATVFPVLKNTIQRVKPTLSFLTPKHAFGLQN